MSGFLLLAMLWPSWGLLPAAPPQSEHGNGPVVRPYDLYDPRFCHLTPQPFLCRRCILAGQQFVQLLEFEADGRPVRSYACRPYSWPYLN